MSKAGGVWDKFELNEEIIDRVFTTAYRLTGKRGSAEELAAEAINKAVGKDGVLTLQASFAGLCASFLQNPCSMPVKDCQLKNNSPCKQAINAGQVQQALLCLDPTVRLVLLLRDMWRLSYEEIARLTGLNKEKVAEALAQGRRNLRDCFFLHR